MHDLVISLIIFILNGFHVYISLTSDGDFHVRIFTGKGFLFVLSDYSIVSSYLPSSRDWSGLSQSENHNVVINPNRILRVIDFPSRF